MNYHDITCDDMKNGDGLRTVLWVAGCSHHCPDCQNPITWDPTDGLPFSSSARNELYGHLEKSYISGLTLSGGDPLYLGNRADILDLVRDVRKRFPNKTIWLYTGFTWEQIMADPEMSDIISFVDVLVDGRFDPELASKNYPWAGSINQRVIDVVNSFKKGEVMLYGSH